MNWQHVALADLAPTPWRNGGGTTRELVAWPDSTDWTWRLSVAEVTASGPFSRYAGVQRWFAVLHGAGVVLDVAGSRHTLDASSAPLAFDGALATDCQLVAGATQDFNLMLRQGAGQAGMLRLHGGCEWRLKTPKTIAMYQVSMRPGALFLPEEMELPPATLVWRRMAACSVFKCSSEHALLLELPP